MWALGNYPSVVTEVIAALGPVLVDATAIAPGDRVLDVAAGSGNASFPAARVGAEVVASDLTPALLDVGARTAGRRPDGSRWEEGDAEALPYDDASFDAVISCVGVMFAPHHQLAADELVRVCRPGGRIGLLSWTPEGFIGQMFATMKPYAPTPPPGVAAAAAVGLRGPRAWAARRPRRGRRGHARQLKVDRFATAAEFREFFKERYGPTIAVYRANAPTPSAAPRSTATSTRSPSASVSAAGRFEWEYLLVTARRR